MMRMASVFSRLKHPLTGAALLFMAGCAGGQAVDVQDGAAADDVAVKSAVAVDSFTTVGKPTKTIETVRGPREIYDPLQDRAVFEAFERIYKRSFAQTNNAETIQASEDDYIILNRALAARRATLQGGGCGTIKESQCGVWFKHLPEPYGLTKYEAGSRSQCLVGGDKTYDRDMHPIGKDFFKLYDKMRDRHMYPELNLQQFGLQQQFANFFQFECKQR